MKLRTRIAPIALTAALSLGLAACGNNDDPAATDDEMTEEMTDDEMTEGMTEGEMDDDMTEGETMDDDMTEEDMDDEG